MPKSIEFEETPSSLLYNDDGSLDIEYKNDIENNCPPEDQYLVVENTITVYCEDEKCRGHEETDDEYPYGLSSLKVSDKVLLLSAFNYDHEMWVWGKESSYEGLFDSDLGHLLCVALIDMVVIVTYGKFAPPKCDITAEKLISDEYSCYGVSLLTQHIYCHCCSRHYEGIERYVSWSLKTVTCNDIDKHNADGSHRFEKYMIDERDGRLTETPSRPLVTDFYETDEDDNDNDISIE